MLSSRDVRVHSVVVDPGLVLDDRFELLSAVRGGAMGDFWRARDRKSGEIVAIRFVEGDPAFARMLDLLISTRPPGMLEVLAYGTSPSEQFYLALALVEGEPLRDVLAGPGLTMRRAVSACRVLAACVARLHAQGVSHGRIDGTRLLLGDAGATLLEPSPAAGSAEADLRGLGAVLYLALTGCEPGTTPARGAPPLPAALVELVGALLAPGHDLPSAAHVAERLEAVLDLDDTYSVKLQREGGEITADLRGGAWLQRLSMSPSLRSALGRYDTLGQQGAPVAATPDLDRAAEASASLVVKPTDRYQLKEMVGQGGLGRVVLAHDRELDRPVAIKELLRRTPSNVQRFRREALVTARLQHPAIVPIHDVGRWPNGAPFYAMKLVEGEDLSARIASATGLADRLALLPKLITVCEAMAYAHAQRIIHRDLKPSNVVVGEFGEAMIVDWGLAKDLDAAESSEASDGEVYREAAHDDLTRAGDVLGTPAYMSPEQARGEPVDARTDVYALGAMLYHLLVGRAPYAESSSEVTAAGYPRPGVRSVIAAPPPPLAELVPDAPLELLAIVEKAMARSAADRYPTALELAAELQRYAAGQLVAAHRYSLAQLLRRWARKHRAALVVAALAACASLVVGAFAVARIVAAERTAQSERGLAVAERARADAARAAAESERNGLLILQAERALASDPTEALRWISLDDSLSPDLHARAVKVAREAVALGVSHTIAELPGQVVGLAVAADRVAAISSGGAARVWASDGVELRTLALGAPGSAVALSSDGVQLVVASEDRRVRWYSDQSGSPREITVPSAVRRAAFAGDRVVLALVDGSVQFWSRSGEVRGQVVHANEPSALFVVGDDAITASYDGTLARTAIDGVRWTVRAHAGGVNAALLVGDTILSGGADGVLRRWRAADGRASGTTVVGAAIAHLGVDGDAVVATSNEPFAAYRVERAVTAETLPFRSGAVCASCGTWQVTSTGPRLVLSRGGERRFLDGHRDHITAVAASGQTLVSADRAGVVRFWTEPVPARVIAGRASSAPATTSSGWVVGLASGALQRIRADGGTSVVGTLSGPITQVAASAQRDVIAAASRDRFTVWVDGRKVVDVPAVAYRIAVSTNGDFAVLFGEPGVGRVWSTRTGELLLDIADAAEFVVVAQAHAYTAAPDGILDFDLAAPAPRRAVLRPLPFAPNVAAPLPSGGLVVASTAGEVQILGGPNVGLGHQILSLHADDAWISAGGGDGTIYRWRPSDGTRAELRGGHARWVHGLTTAGGHLASWSWAAPTLRLWRPSDGVIAYVPTSEPMLGAAYDSGPTSLVVTDNSGTIRMVEDELDRQAMILPGGLATFVRQYVRAAR